jgi:predicted enzyme related to lactoylglutathione lyase
MNDESPHLHKPTSPVLDCCTAGSASTPAVAGAPDVLGLPAVVDRATFRAELDRLRVREKAHTREGDVIAAARRRLPMVEVDAGGPGCSGLIDAVGMANRLAGITIDCANPARLASFWSAILNMTVTGEHGRDPGWATVGSRLGDQPRLTFQQVPEPKTAKVRIHLDIQVDDIDAGRHQVESLGGRWSGTRHDYDEGVVMVMHDPEEHEFCLVQYYD